MPFLIVMKSKVCEFKGRVDFEAGPFSSAFYFNIRDYQITRYTIVMSDVT